MKEMKKIFVLCLASFLIGQTILAQPETSAPVEIPDPVLVWRNVETVKGSDGNPYIGITLGISNYAQFPAILFAKDSTLPPCGSNTAASRAWLRVYDAQSNKEINNYCRMNTASELRTFSFNVKRENLPSRVYVVVDDRAAKKTYKSNCINPMNGEACASAPIINGGNINIGKGIEKIRPHQFEVLQPDLVITNIWVSEDNNRVTVRVKNNCKGDVTASFPVNLYIHETADPKSKVLFGQARKITAKLTAGVTGYVEFDISQFSKGKDIFATNSYEILVDSGNYIEETNEKNNTITSKVKTIDITVDLCSGK
jgi:hypothetical protein